MAAVILRVRLRTLSERPFRALLDLADRAATVLPGRAPAVCPADHDLRVCESLSGYSVRLDGHAGVPRRESVTVRCGLRRPLVIWLHLQRQAGLTGQACLLVRRDHALAVMAKPCLDLRDGIAAVVNNSRH